jgi:ABC-type antimicrobial peptide transport system permease subunit
VADRTRGEPTDNTGSIREAVRSIDPLLPIDDVRTMEQAIADSSLCLHRIASMMGICGAIALLLSLLGIYSTMVYSMSQRTQEFGVRMASAPRAALCSAWR